MAKTTGKYKRHWTKKLAIDAPLNKAAIRGIPLVKEWNLYVFEKAGGRVQVQGPVPLPDEERTQAVVNLDTSATWGRLIAVLAACHAIKIDGTVRYAIKTWVDLDEGGS